MPTTKVKQKVKQIKGLTQYRNLTDEEIIAVAEEMLEKKDKKDKDILDIAMFFDNKEEKKSAEKLLAKYMDNYSLESVSDKNTLLQLIFLEVIHLRLMKNINQIQKDTGATPNLAVEGLHKNIKEITSLKSQLGILKSKSSGDSASALDILKKKYKTWMSENQASRQFVCPGCGQMVLLKIKIDQYDTSLHPYFKDRILFNEEIVRLYLKGTISSQSVAKIMGCSEFYCDWVVKKMWPTNPKYDEIKKEIEVSEVVEIKEIHESEDEVLSGEIQKIESQG